MISNINAALLIGFETNCSIKDFPDTIKHLWNCEWSYILDDLSTKLLSSNITSKLEIIEYLKVLPNSEAFIIGIASLIGFCEINWTGPKTVYHSTFIFQNEEIFQDISPNGEDIYLSINNLEIFWIAIEIFKLLPNTDLVYCWWKLRCYYIYQQILEEPSPNVFKSIQDIVSTLISKEEELDLNLKTRLNIEINQAYLMYRNIQECEKYLYKIETYAGLKLKLKGVLGKRTKYQQQAVAQPAPEVITNDFLPRVSACETHSYCIPIPLKLDDDLRLENILYINEEENVIPELTSLEQVICLNLMQYAQQAQVKDELSNDELLTFINLILAQKCSPWSVRVYALFIKCRLESKHKRTIEKSMMQCETIVNNYSNEQPNLACRLSYIWMSGLPLIKDSHSQYAELLMNIGLVKAALNIYLKLQMWENVIACYTVLQLHNKAAEIIQQEIDKKPSAKLYCLLGDATDDVSLYEKAWSFSKRKSSRAQRYWGDFYFNRKNYEECIQHYEKSCEINSLQEAVWFKLGFAALRTEKWDLAATAYRRYTYLEPHSFEAWNNLANVYVKQKNKPRAYKALTEALKYNYDNWQIWENMALISLDTGHISDVIRSYHRLLDLKEKYLDVELLCILMDRISNNTEDADGNCFQSMNKRLLELFGRITSKTHNDPTIWELYADLSPNELLRSQRLLKACTIIKQKRWIDDESLSKSIFKVIQKLVNSCLKTVNEGNTVNETQLNELISSTVLIIKSIMAVMSKEGLQNSENFLMIDNSLNNLLKCKSGV